jgi:hypothetical protein
MTGCKPVTRARHCQWYDAPDTCVGAYADLDVLAGMCGQQVTESFGLQAGPGSCSGPTLAPKVLNCQSEAWRTRP